MCEYPYTTTFDPRITRIFTKIQLPSTRKFVKIREIRGQMEQMGQMWTKNHFHSFGGLTGWIEVVFLRGNRFIKK